MDAVRPAGGGAGPGTGHRSTRAAVIAVLAALVMSVRYLYVMYRDRVSDTTPPPFGARTLVDFRDAVWLPGRAFLRGVNPYDSGTYLPGHPFAQEFGPYTPGHLVLWAPLNLLSWDVAALLHLLLSGLAVGAVGAWGGRRVLGELVEQPGRAAEVTAAAIGVLVLWVSRPMVGAVSAGQPSTFYALLVVPALIGIRSGPLTVVLIGLACLKPQIGLPAIVVLLAQRRFAVCVGGIGVAGALSLPAVVMLSRGPSGFGGWLATFLGSAEASRASVFTGGAGAVLDRIDLEALGLSFGWVASPTQLGVVTVLTLAAVYAAQRCAIRLGIGQVGTALALALGLQCLAHGSYDACWLTIPTALALVRVSGDDRRARWRLGPGLVLLAAAQLPATSKVDAVLGLGTGVALERALILVGAAVLALGTAAYAGARSAPLHRS